MVNSAYITALMSILMVAIFGLDMLFGGALKIFGVQPRDISTIYTIFTAPWLHGDSNHLLNNLSAFILLSFIAALQGVRYYLKSSAIIIVIGGVLVWIFGRDANHIGASGWIFGLWGMIIARAWFDRSFLNIIIGIAVIFFYGSMALALLPLLSYVSFESHIFGAAAGILCAAYLKPNRPADKLSPPRSQYDVKFRE